jgi:hypothetical protein
VVKAWSTSGQSLTIEEHNGCLKDVALRCEKTGNPFGPLRAEPAPGWIAGTERLVQNRRSFSPH